MRVLVVDDDVSVRSLVRLALEPTEVEEAADGVSALGLVADRARAHRAFDVVLLDVLMGAADGFSVLRQLRAAHGAAGPAVLMLTGRTDEEHHLVAFRAGADGYLTKPVDPVDLESAVATAGARSVPERIAHRSRELARAEFLRTLESGFVSAPRSTV